MERKNAFITSIIKKMSFEEKIGGLLTLGFSGTLPRKHIYDFVTKYHCGGLRLSPTTRSFGNYIDPESGKVTVKVDNKHFLKAEQQPLMELDQYKDVLEELQTLAMARPSGVPLHFSFDQEGGTSADFNFGGVELFPKPMGIAATGNKDNAYLVSEAIAKQSLSVGFNYVHSPVLDINTNPNNPEIYTRAYSDDVSTVIAYAREACKGFKEANMIATGKHFPGRGDSDVDAHYHLPVIDVDKETLYKRELLPYKVLIEEDLLPSIMIAHSIYPALDPENVATVSYKIVTGILREELGFKGVITTDSMTMGALAMRYGVANACAMSLVAGCDLILMKAENGLVEETIQKIKQFVQEDKLTLEDIEEKLYRILKLKYDYKMFSGLSCEKPETVIRSGKYSHLAKDIARRSIQDYGVEKIKAPLDRQKKTLIIEQMNKGVPNNGYWYYGYFYHQSLKCGLNADFYEIDYVIDQEDMEKILEMCHQYERIIITNFYVRSKKANNPLINQLEKAYQGELITIVNTPYSFTKSEKNQYSVLTYATTPRNLDAVCDYLYKGINPLGESPLRGVGDADE